MKTFKELRESLLDESSKRYIFSGEVKFMEKNKDLFKKFGAKTIKVTTEDGMGEDIAEYTIQVDSNKVDDLGSAFEAKDKRGESYGGWWEA